MKKIQKNDLRLEKEVISRLSQGELTDVRGGIDTKPQTQLNVDCYHPISYDNNCKTLNLVATCKFSCGGGCMVKSVNIMCDPVPYNTVENCMARTVDKSVCNC